MTAYLLMLILASQVALVAGQIFLKHGMSKDGGRAMAGSLVAGIGLLTLWFFLWLGLLQNLDISYVFPFEGIAPVLLVIAAWLILKERLSLRAWIGVMLIAGGTALVGMSGKPTTAAKAAPTTAPVIIRQ